MPQLDWPTLAEEVSRGTVRDPLQHFRARTKRNCPLCGFTRYFLSAGVRQEARCPNCASKERDRIIALHLKRSGLDPSTKRVFSAERPFFHRRKRNPSYVAGDIKKGAVANAVADITALQYPDDEFDVIVCNHVLEHVQEDEKGRSALHVRHVVQAGAWLEVDEAAYERIVPPPVTADPGFPSDVQWLELVRGDSVDLYYPEGAFVHVVSAIAIEYAPRKADFVVVERHREQGGLIERSIKQVEIKGKRIELWPRSRNPKWQTPLKLDDAADDETVVQIAALVLGAYLPAHRWSGSGRS